MDVYYAYEGLSFVWDSNKNEINKENHGISFEEACTCFLDPNYVEVFDAINSKDEDYYQLVGLSELFKLLLVAHCVRENETTFRIVSARKAQFRAKKLYERGIENGY